MPGKKSTVKDTVRKYIFMFVGTILAAVGLEIFLVPNQIIDGGVIGIAIMTSYITHLPLGAFIFALNLPFIYLGYMQIGRSFAIATLFSLLSLSLWVSVLQPIPGLTNDVFLASIFGGIILGIGVGLIIRYGGSLDGTEIIAIIIDKRTGFSVGEIIMCFNIFILGSAGLIFSWDKAMYSLVTYFVAFKMIDITIEGLDESKGVLIVSDKPEEIAEVLMARLGRGVTILHGQGAYSGESKQVLYSVITRLEIAKLKAIIKSIDENAFVTISEVHDVLGGKVKKRAIH